MESTSILELENKLLGLKNEKLKLSKELNDLDTEIIGIRLALDKAKEKERISLDQERSKERSYR